MYGLITKIVNNKQSGLKMDKEAIQEPARSQMSGYTNREDYENMVTVSKERKQTCPEQRHSRKVHHPGIYWCN